MFCASLIYVVLFPLLAVVAVAVARIEPTLYHVVVTGVLGTAYLAILSLLHLSKSWWTNVGTQGSRNPWRFVQVFEVRGVEWLNIVGIAVVLTIVAILLLAGMMPYISWFLFGAVALGCSDLIRPRQLNDLQPTFRRRVGI